MIESAYVKRWGFFAHFLGYWLSRPINRAPSVVGGKDDEHISVEVQTLSDIHNGQFEALVSSGGRKEIDIRSYFNTGTASGLKAGEKWILFFASDANLEEETLHPYYMEKVN